MKDYYNARALEYDHWYLGTGLFAARKRPGWERAVRSLAAAIAALEPARTLDVACGTGFLTQHLRGAITALDQSERMLELARERLPDATLLRGDALELPFGDGAFERLFTGHFYGHLEEPERGRFLSEARRVAVQLVVADAALRPDHGRAERQQRTLGNGATYEVFKRYFDPEALLAELGGGEVLHASQWFVVVAS